MNALLLAVAMTGAAQAAATPRLPGGAEIFSRLGLEAPAALEGQAAPPPVTARAVVDGPLITPDLWRRLPAPSAADVQKLVAAFPWVPSEAVREVTLTEAQLIVGQAVAQGSSPLDLFTDRGLQGDEVYYLSGDTLAALTRTFEIPSALMISGTDKDSKPFHMEAIAMGRRHADVLYDRDFKYDNPFLPGYSYIVKRTVHETILADGQMALDGLSVDAGLFKPKIKKITKLSPTEVRVETTMGDRTKPLRLIRRLAPAPGEGQGTPLP
jgi:hypothetical protein